MILVINYFKRICLIVAIMCYLVLGIFAQSSDWMPQFQINTLDSMHLKYTKPEIFTEVAGSDCFKGNEKLQRIMVCGGNQLHSKKKKFIVFIMISSVHTRETDSEQIITVLPPNSPYKSETKHIFYIRKDIKESLGVKAAQTWKDYVDYYPPEKATKKFKADTVITYSIPLDRQDYYQDKYKNLRVLVIQKKERQFVRIYCFYRNMWRRKVAKYMAAVENIFRYEE